MEIVAPVLHVNQDTNSIVVKQAVIGSIHVPILMNFKQSMANAHSVQIIKSQLYMANVASVSLAQEGIQLILVEQGVIE